VTRPDPAKIADPMTRDPETRLYLCVVNSTNTVYTDSTILDSGLSTRHRTCVQKVADSTPGLCGTA